MKRSNKQLGNEFEKEFCEVLSNKGFWVLNVPQYTAGQPADVIAVKDGSSYLIDCKVCSGKGFMLSRIEDNQLLSMFLWKECGNGDGWFAIKTNEGEIWMINLPALEELKVLKSTVNHDDLKEYGQRLEEWLLKSEKTLK